MRSHQGGIYRNVQLIRKSDKAYIRWNGVRVTTPGLAENQGRASIVQVDGDHGQMVPMILPDVFQFFNQYNTD